MVVFHWNLRVSRYKSPILVALILFLFYIYIFEITYHFLHSHHNDEPIDVVYTWVNGSDELFQFQLNTYLQQSEKTEIDSSHQRFHDKNELRFSLRSLEKNAPWIRHVYIVTNGQIPHWLNLDYEKVTIVTHKDIFEDQFNVPSFSSPAIEIHLHRIPGISKRFIYFNDDIFLGRPIYKDDFHSESRGFLVYLSWLLPMCSPGCFWLYVADGHCDKACDNFRCQKDGGDCDETSRPLLGDVIFRPDDYEQDLENRTIKAPAKNLTQFFNDNGVRNMTQLIEKYNRSILLFDKLRRRKVRKISNGFGRFSFVDAYGESLQHTNRILNDFYGFSVRKVPSHAPIMIDKEIMENLWKKFRKYLEKTARNRFRTADDLQFAFIYYYHLIHEKKIMTLTEIFQEFDTDSSGSWSDNEMRTVISRIYDLPLTEESFAHFTGFLVNCSSLSALKDLLITKEFIKGCQPLSSLLQLHFGVTKRHNYELIKDAEKRSVSFKMLNSNISHVFRQLDEVRRKPRKFVCLNDNLDHSAVSRNAIIQGVLLDFYTSLFPVPSKFELPVNYRNRFLHMDEYYQFLNNQQKQVLGICCFFLLILIVLLLKYFKRNICHLLQTCFC